MKISLSQCRNSGSEASHHVLCVDKATPSVKSAISSRYIIKNVMSLLQMFTVMYKELVLLSP